MNIMNYLTKKHMLTNKKRTLMTILGVIISVAMITAVSTASSTFLDLLQRIAMNNEGAWHVKYNNFPVEDTDKLEQESMSENVFYTKYLAYGKLKDAQIINEEKPYLYMLKFNQAAMEEMALKLVDGRFPKAENEIVLPEHLGTNGGVSYKVGDIITIDLGDRYVEEYSEETLLHQNNPYMSGDDEVLAENSANGTIEVVKESFMLKDSLSYTVVGIMSRPSFEPFSAPGYTAITYLDMDLLTKEDRVNAYVFANHINKDFYNQSRELANNYGISEWDVIFNEGVLRYYGISQYDDFNQMINGLAFILILIIMVGSISLIYNSFAISITERSKQFGMLSSVGATRQQKRNAIFYEGSVIGIIAIPLGILAGILGMSITFYIVGPMLTYSVGIDVPLRMKVSLTSIVVAVIFSILTIFISAFIPAKRASRISPMDAIRQNKDIKLHKKRMKANKLTKVFFGIEGDLAQKNLNRNRRRYRALVFSLFISLILFISVGSYSFYLSKALKMTTARSNYDIALYLNQRIPLEEEASYLNILERFQQVEGINNGTKIIHSPINFELDDKFTANKMTKEFLEAKEIIYRSWGFTEEEVVNQMNENGHRLFVEIVALDDTSYENFLHEVSASTSDRKEAEQGSDNTKQAFDGILINKHQDQFGYSLIESNVLNINENENINLYYQSYEEVIKDNDEVEYIEQEKFEIPMKLQAVTTKVPIGLSYASMTSAARIVISDSTYKELVDYIQYKEDPNLNVYYYGTLTIPKGIEERIKAALAEYSASSFYITNRYEDAQQDKQLMMVLSIFAYGFITLISLICMTNLCNTIATSFALRRREFAMLKSVGMTPKSFNRMIRFESLLYGIKALLYGLPVSLFITYKIYETVNSNFTTDFTSPWAIYIVGIVSVFIVVGVAMAYSTFKVKDESIIDGLKSEIE